MGGTISTYLLLWLAPEMILQQLKNIETDLTMVYLTSLEPWPKLIQLQLTWVASRHCLRHHLATSFYSYERNYRKCSYFPGSSEHLCLSHQKQSSVLQSWPHERWKSKWILQLYLQSQTHAP